MSLEQIVGQMIFSPFDSTYLSSDTDDYDKLVSWCTRRRSAA
jgi:hypothetical protein